MCAAGRHRGSDDNGVHIDGAAGLGMQRLSIIDVSGGHQPIFNEDRSCHRVNGEIWPPRRVPRVDSAGTVTRRAATPKPSCTRTRNTARSASRTCGMFAIAIWDAKRRRLFLARDRMERSPLL
jgi:asparagine synthase (glutamine-hydrolysing)